MWPHYARSAHRARRSTLDVLTKLAALLDKSLVVRASGEEAEPRYGMLETIRAYGHDRLAVSGEEDQVRDRHAAYFGALAEAAEPGLTGPEQVAWMDRAEREHANLRAALGWPPCASSGICAGSGTSALPGAGRAETA